MNGKPSGFRRNPYDGGARCHNQIRGLSMKTKQTTITEIGRQFINSLPASVAQQTPQMVDFHFHISDDQFGDLFLSKEQSQALYDCVQTVEHELAPLWDEKSLRKLTEQMMIQAVDPKRIQAGVKFSKRATAALEAWNTELLQPPAIWEVYFRVCNLSREGLPVTV